MTNPHLKRRTLLKAASAAGIVWASPVLDSVTAHAAGTCTNAQFNGLRNPVTTTNPANDPNCSGAPTCSLGGVTGSRCTCGAFTAGSPAVTGGSWSGLTYTAPAGCKILAANARRFNLLASGCALRWPCDPGTISAAGTSVTFPALATGEFNFAFRMILCC